MIESVPTPMQPAIHVYEVRPRKDHRSLELLSDVLPFGRLLYGEPTAVSYAQFSAGRITLSFASTMKLAT